MNSPWRIEMFGGLRLLQDGGPTINRFQTRKTAALLAYLAYYRDKIVAREILADLLWPDHDPDAARNSLRVALTSLRRQLEPPGVPAGAVLMADRASIHLNPASFTTDVADFDAAMREEKIAPDDAARTQILIRAVDMYRGQLLLGWYEEWIDLEQARLSEVYSGALRRITTNLTRAGEYERALEYAQRAVTADPLREETNRNLMRLYAVLGQPAAAREQYRRLENLLQKELRTVPATATRELMKQIAALPAQGVPVPPRPMTPADASPTAASVAGVGAAVVDTPAAPVAAPAVSSANTAPIAGNVPLQFTRFLGREREIARLEEMLRPALPGSPPPSRLVTLTGPGGIGKTRLAIEVAQRMRGQGYQNRVWVVSLADLTDGEQIGSALLAAFRLPSQTDIVALDQITSLLCGNAQESAGVPALLVLDNLEQIADSAAFWINELLSRLPNLTILATSRQHLPVSGEQDYVIPALPTPPAILPTLGSGLAAGEAAVDLEWMAANPSVALFVDRARAVRPDFQITARNAAPIGEICRRLDGLPLAIELAAAGVRLLSPAQMLERLIEQNDILSSERRDLSARHRSLRAVMDESYNLLSPEAQAFFARLSVFSGGWTLDAARAISGVESALGLLDNLQQMSLVNVVETPGGVRFRYLETIRLHADSKLSVEERAGLQATHADYFRTFAESIGGDLRGTEEAAATAIEAIGEEWENLLAAIRRTLASEPIVALRFGVALWRYWYSSGNIEQGYDLLSAALRTVDSPETSEAVCAATDLCRLRVIARHGAGRLALSAGNVGIACEHFARAMELLPSDLVPGVGIRPSFQTMLLLDYAIALEGRGEYGDAASKFAGLAGLYHAHDDRWAEACALSSRGAVLSADGNAAEASRVYEESAALRRSLGDRWGGSVDFTTGSSALDAAEAAFAAAVGESEDAEAGIAASFLQLGHIATEQGDYAAALPLLRESLAAYRRMDDEGGAAIASERVALTALRQGDWATARRAAEDALLLRRAVPRSGERVRDTDRFAQLLVKSIAEAEAGGNSELL